MRKGILSDFSGTEKLGILFVLIIFFTIIFGVIGMFVAYFQTGIGLNSSQLSNLNNPNTILYMKISQIFQAIGLFIIPPIIAIITFGKKGENYLQFNKTKFLYILAAGSLMLLALPLITWLAEINQSINFPDSLSGVEEWMRINEISATEITESFLKTDTIIGLLFNLFIMALIPAFGEEMLFRGVLQKIFTQMSKNIHIGIWITAFLFSAIHMQFLTFLPRFFMGAVFGYFLFWSGSIWVPIAAHFVNNATAIISNYLYQNKLIETDLENLETENQVYYIFLSTLLVGLILYYLYKGKEKTQLSRNKDSDSEV